MMSKSSKKFKQGFFNPKNPEKWVLSSKGITNGTCIRYMSSWELKVMRFLDENTEILKISSEPFAIPYISPKDNKEHRYYPDFIVKTSKAVFLVEVKPFAQTQKPKQPKRMTAKARERYIDEVYTYEINQAKWKAAQELCNSKNMKFLILTENEIRV